MNKLNFLIIILILLSSCSFNKNSAFWTSSEDISLEKNTNFKEIFPKEEALKKEFNSNLKIKLTSNTVNKTYANNYLNNNNR